jgi:hypothetical protein
MAWSKLKTKVPPNHLVLFPVAVVADVGVEHYTGYNMRMRQTDSGSGALVTSMSQIHWDIGIDTTVNAATNLFISCEM